MSFCWPCIGPESTTCWIKRGDLSGKVIVSCSLPLNAQNANLVLGHTTSGAEELAKKVPGAEVIAAFNNVPSEVLFGVFRLSAPPPVASMNHRLTATFDQ